AASAVSLPAPSFRNGGPQPRVSSPAPGRSTLITSAPRSPRFCAAQGPARTRDRSSTRICESGPAIKWGPSLFSKELIYLGCADGRLGQQERREGFFAGHRG